MASDLKSNKVRDPDFALKITKEDIKTAQQEIAQDLVKTSGEMSVASEPLIIDGSAEDVSGGETKKESAAGLKIAQIRANIATIRQANKEEKEKPLPDGEHEIMKGSGEDAELKERLMIQNGMKNGICEFWNKGVIKMKATYINDVKDGPAISYNSDGEMSSKEFYKDDLKHGVVETYKKGKVASMEMFEKGRANGIKIKYGPQGIVKMKTPKVDGLTHGLEESYDKLGRVTKTCEYANNIKNGYQKTYYPTGKLRKIEEFRNGIREGKEREFYPEGQLKAETEYQSGKIVRTRIDYTMDGKIIEK